MHLTRGAVVIINTKNYMLCKTQRHPVGADVASCSGRRDVRQRGTQRPAAEDAASYEAMQHSAPAKHHLVLKPVLLVSAMELLVYGQRMCKVFLP